MQKLYANKFKVIGLTGNIGSGKSFVLHQFLEFGFFIFSADAAVKEILDTKEIINQIHSLWPNTIKNGRINKDALFASTIGKSIEQNKKLQAMLHPLVEYQRQQALDNAKMQDKAIVCEIPLLFETNTEHQYDYIIVTTASLQTRANRVMLRKNMTLEKFHDIVKLQSEDIIHNPSVDFIIDTEKTKQDTITQIRSIIEN